MMVVAGFERRGVDAALVQEANDIHPITRFDERPGLLVPHAHPTGAIGYDQFQLGVAGPRAVAQRAHEAGDADPLARRHLGDREDDRVRAGPAHDPAGPAEGWIIEVVVERRRPIVPRQAEYWLNVGRTRGKRCPS